MATFKYGADVWPYTPASAKTAGDVVFLGVNSDLAGVVVTDLAASQLGAVRVSGAFEFPTDETGMIQGDAAYWDGTAVTDDTSDDYLGRVSEYITAGVITVAINLESTGS
jgi:predicted RecA/RadA family phage recombinase